MRVLDGRKKLNIAMRTTAGIMAAVCAFTCIPFSPAKVVMAAPKTFTMDAARSLALENSTAYESASDKILAKQAAYDSAVKSINVKEKDMKTFRWSPLLSFKFPTSPNFAEASEFQYKPVALSYDIKVAQHQMQDKVFEINEKTSTLYTDIVVLQQSISFNERRAKAVEDGLAKNQAKLRIGQAKQADVDKLEKQKESLNRL